MTALMTKAIRHSWTASVRLPQTDGRPSEGFSDDGVRSRIYSLHPVVPSTTTSPPLFLTELPLPLVQFVPAPLFRRFAHYACMSANTPTHPQPRPGAQQDTKLRPCIACRFLHLLSRGLRLLRPVDSLISPGNANLWARGAGGRAPVLARAAGAPVAPGHARLVHLYAGKSGREYPDGGYGMEQPGPPRRAIPCHHYWRLFPAGPGISGLSHTFTHIHTYIHIPT